MAELNSSIRNFPTATDILAEILLRLPPNVRRRFRLVSRLWRAVIDRRTDMRARGKILAVTTEGISYVIDVLSPGSPPRYLMWSPLDPGETECYNAMSIVGTCNGIVCLCDNRKPGGALTLVNKSINQTRDLPPLPTDSDDDAIELLQGRCRGGGWNWHQTYSFAYLPMTRRYKVVHVPSHFDPSVWELNTVHVFTLGEASWRDVHAGPSARCVLGPCRLADVDGTVYWMTGYTGRVVALNLEDESVTHTQPLPPFTGPGESWLTKVHGRLGLVVGGGESVTVWVLEGEGWSRRYIVEARLWQTEHRLRWEVTMPHFAGGDYVLTHGGSGKSIDGRRISEAQDGVVLIRRNDQAETMVSLPYRIHQTFPYIETYESLYGIYR